jgi:hypothetical protein
MRLSIIIEWENTRLNGMPRAWALLDVLQQQWKALIQRKYPGGLPAETAGFLDAFDPRAEVILVSGGPLDGDLVDRIRGRLPEGFDLRVQVAEGLEYYPLKNLGGQLARGDLLLFVDSDVLPEEGWLAHLLGSFVRPEVDVVCAQTYIAPTGLFARAFALGWTYALRDDSGRLIRPRKYYANTIAFRRAVFKASGFPSVGRRSRGACSLLRTELESRNIAIWENRSARVDHPPPAGFRHLVIRALAHGRDHAMKVSERRTLRGLARCLGIAATRWGVTFYRTFRYWRRVGLSLPQVPAVLAIMSAYYGIFALGGLLTYASPDFMAQRFRV